LRGYAHGLLGASPPVRGEDEHTAGC
jgi:hypothetical protein